MELNAHFNLRENENDRDYNVFKVNAAHEEISLYVGIIMVNFFLLVRWVGLRDWQDLPT